MKSPRTQTVHMPNRTYPASFLSGLWEDARISCEGRDSGHVDTDRGIHARRVIGTQQLAENDVV